ncbi:unnamed protein product, partial [Dibothriocephalus latus]
MADDLRSQGFEIVTDENGQELVKLMFMDENNETSGYALVSTEDAKKIMTGEATLQNEQEDGANPTATVDEAGEEPVAAAAADDFAAS